MIYTYYIIVQIKSHLIHVFPKCALQLLSQAAAGGTTSADRADESSTEYSSSIGQTSSVSSSISAGAVGMSASTKHFVTVTQSPTKVLQKRTGNLSDSKIKVYRVHKFCIG